MDRVRGKSRQLLPFFASGKGPLSPIYKRPLRRRDPSVNPHLTRSVESLRKSVPQLDSKPVLGIGFGALAEVQLSQRDVKPLTSLRTTKPKTSLSPLKKAPQAVSFPETAIAQVDAATARPKLASMSLSRSFVKLPGTYRRYFPGRNSKRRTTTVLKGPQTCTTDRAPLFHNLSIREKCL